MSTTIAAVLVTSCAVSFLATIFTRDAFFSLAAFVAFWTFIFSDVYYSGIIAVVRYNYMFAAVLSAALTGVALAELINSGVLINVWLDRPSRSDRSGYALQSLPVGALMVLFAFLATFFFYLGALLSLWAGFITVSSSWPWYILGGLFALAAIISLFLLAFTVKWTKFEFYFDGKIEVYYVFAFIFAAITPALIWHVSWSFLSTSFAAGTFARAALTAGIAFFFDLLVLGIGVLLERNAEKKAGSATIVRFDGLDGGEHGLVLFLRVFVISLMHGLIYLFGGFVDVSDAAYQAAIDVFWIPHLFLLFAIAFGIYAIAYLIRLCVVAGESPKSTKSESSAEEQEPLLVGTNAAQRTLSKSRKSPPAQVRSRPAASRDLQLKDIQFV